MKPLKVDELKEELEARGEATSAVGQQGMPAPVAVHARRGDRARVPRRSEQRDAIWLHMARTDPDEGGRVQTGTLQATLLQAPLACNKENACYKLRYKACKLPVRGHHAPKRPPRTASCDREYNG